MPEVLSPAEVSRLFDATPSLRDRLVLGMFAEGGIKVGELCELKWRDVTDGGAEIRVVGASGDSRTVELPQPWAGLLGAGKATYKPEEYVVAGRRPGKPCRTRTVERIVWAAARRATIGKVISSMTLRHSHAVACLRAGMDDRSLQVRLGHASIETTMLYRRFVPYTPWVSPLDLVPVQPVPANEERPSAASLPQEGFLTRALRTIQSFVIPRPMPSGP
jgi:integrase